MKAAFADPNCFPQLGHLHFCVIGSERTPSVSPSVPGRDDVTAALAELVLLPTHNTPNSIERTLSNEYN
jgi:hypothetical protein